ncbi:cytidine deaminase [Angustibacter aerolatus]|uniref:Cytidine deaminase n=1 Tax=Angustibacter aerolatus TaxID=1162965 RepID=A0ABQ6JL19_9ACTN|nr:cytidine deaminase [Angustibacter aerolatus]GMA88261.1 cytidine deaminase [Angustibacter aerolatus]
MTDGTGAQDVDWEALRALAVEAMGRAYAPYSRYPVGVAGLVDDGRVVSGCNVENAAYGVALCAECGMVSDLVRTGGGRLVAVSCVDGQGRLLMACGRCRRLLWEHGGPDCAIDTTTGVRPLREPAARRVRPGRPHRLNTAEMRVAVHLSAAR